MSINQLPLGYTIYKSSLNQCDWLLLYQIYFQIFYFTPLSLNVSWRRSLSYRKQLNDLLSKSMDWFLYDEGFCHERVWQNFTLLLHYHKINLTKVYLISFVKSYEISYWRDCPLNLTIVCKGYQKRLSREERWSGLLATEEQNSKRESQRKYFLKYLFKKRKISTKLKS